MKKIAAVVVVIAAGFALLGAQSAEPAAAEQTEEGQVRAVLGEYLAEKMRHDDAYERAMREALEFKSWGSSDGRYPTREETHDRSRR